MDDIGNALILFFIFGLVLLLYGLDLKLTGNKRLLPYRLLLTVSSKSDVQHVGLWVVRTAVVVLFVVALLALLNQLIILH